MVTVELQFLEDIARSAHLAALAMCFLLVISADLTASKSVFRPLTAGDFKRLHTNHAALASGLIILWVSGLFIIWRATAFDLAQFSPKLIAKIVVVSLLTANAFVIGKLALPYFQRNEGAVFGEFSLGVRLRLASCAALSSASWICAFCLGAIPWLKTASAAELIDFLGPIYAAFFAAAFVVAALSGRRKTEVVAADPSPLLLGVSRRLSQSRVFPAE